MSRTRKVERRILPSGKVVFRAPYLDGEGNRRSRNFDTAKEAKAFLLTVGGELRLGTHTPASTSPTVTEAGQLWLDDCRRRGLEERSIADYEAHLRLHIAPFLGTTKLAAVTSPIVASFAVALHEAGRSRDMVRRVVISLGTLFAEARRLGLVATSPTDGVNRKQTNRKNPRPMIPSKPELNAIIAAATERGPRWRAFFLTAIFCGPRAGELRGLRWSDVDLKDGAIHIGQRADARRVIGKCKTPAAYRTIPVAMEVIEALRIWKLQCPHGEHGLVFPNEAGGVYDYRNLTSRHTDPILKGTRGAKYGLHSLRHACASLWIESGFNPKKIQALMGHSSIQVTFDTYGHLFQDTDSDQRAAARVQQSLLGGAP